MADLAFLGSLTLQDGCLFHGKKGKPLELPAALAPLADSHGHLTSFRRRDPGTTLCRAALAGVQLLVVPVDPTDDVKDAPAFLDWFDDAIETGRKRLAACVDQGVVPPVVAGFEDEVPLLGAVGGVADGPGDAGAGCAGGDAGVGCPVDRVRFIAGAHPYGAQLLDEAALARLDLLLASPRCVGIGEIGLDFGPYNEVPAEDQEQAFRLQLRMAHERKLPVELHIRDANDDPDAAAHKLAEKVLREEGVPAAGCDLHCFTSGPDVMDPFVELGCHIAFGGAATFNRSVDIREAAVACPTDLLLSETDCPYMAPVPLRGQECEPAMVAFTAARLAQARDEAGVSTPAETYRAFYDNAKAFFSL